MDKPQTLGEARAEVLQKQEQIKRSTKKHRFLIVLVLLMTNIILIFALLNQDTFFNSSAFLVFPIFVLIVISWIWISEMFLTQKKTINELILVLIDHREKINLLGENK